MVRFVARRLLASIPVVVLSSFAVFAMVALSTDPLGGMGSNPSVPAAVVAQRTAELHLDEPVVVRYLRWASSAVQGDLGRTLDGRPVGPLVRQRLAVSARLVGLGVVAAVLVALVLGTVGAVRRGRLADHALSAMTMALVSLPLFWLGALLKEYAAVRVNRLAGRQLVATVGSATPNLAGGLWSRLGDYASHLVLPTLALALTAGAAWSRYQRAALAEVLEADYVRFARAKGLPRRTVLVRHGLRNALVPLTNVVAVDLAAIVGGAIVLERVFSWQGMGELLLEGVGAGDVNVVAAWLLVTSVLVVLFNLAADVLHGVLDPRARVG